MFGDVVRGRRRTGTSSTRSTTLQGRARRQARRRAPGDDLEELDRALQGRSTRTHRTAFPQDPHEQLCARDQGRLRLVEPPRARVYRRTTRSRTTSGTAVNVQAMVFGNMGDDSRTGVGFTRDPTTGENGFYGEYLINAQGEDVVAGIRTPRAARPSCATTLPKPSTSSSIEIVDAARAPLQGHAGHRVHGRGGRSTCCRPAPASAPRRRRADRRRDGRGGADRRETTRSRAIDPAQLDHLLHPTLDPDATYDVVATGIAASPGAASGRSSSTPTTRRALREPGRATSSSSARRPAPKTSAGMRRAGHPHRHGGKTSHAAVVARGMGKPCVVGCAALTIDDEREIVTIDGHELARGRLHHASTARTGERHPRRGADRAAEHRPATSTSSWRGPTRSARSRCAPTPTRPPTRARPASFGAEGIGLCRTEHMFFGDERIPSMREMILADDEPARARRARPSCCRSSRADFDGHLRGDGGCR